MYYLASNEGRGAWGNTLEVRTAPSFLGPSNFIYLEIGEKAPRSREHAMCRVYHLTITWPPFFEILDPPLLEKAVWKAFVYTYLLEWKTSFPTHQHSICNTIPPISGLIMHCIYITYYI